jgi:predicted nuclease of restriction endonuclease-like (RecB) superfamily
MRREFYHTLAPPNFTDFFSISAHVGRVLIAAPDFSSAKRILQMQIESAAHLRQGNTVNNFASRLPTPQSDLVQQTLKDPYLFDFLTLEKNFHERELETGLVRHLEKFLLELGQGFAFVGRQYQVSVGEEDFYIELLFYHLKLRCFVVIGLKRGNFKPEYAGKLNFYCNVVDDVIRHTHDQLTLGLMLCQGKNRVIADLPVSRSELKQLTFITYEA